MFAGQFYELVVTRQGYFVIPGEGARLPNGLMMGSDIKITATSDIAAMTRPGGALHHDGYAFAYKLALALSLALEVGIKHVAHVINTPGSKEVVAACLATDLVEDEKVKQVITA